MAAFSVDVVVPTVRADVSTLRRAIELPVPPAFLGLRFLIVVDGPQSEAAWEALRSMAASNSSVSLLSTQPNHHGWPAGASAARNTGIENSRADWVLFLDDDTMPEPNLLFEYCAAMEQHLGPGARRDGLPAFGFAGVTCFAASEDSLWAIVARCSGMLDAFTSASRSVNPPWSPTANLMLRRAAFGPVGASHEPTPSVVAPVADVVDEPNEGEGERTRLLPDGTGDARPSLTRAESDTAAHGTPRLEWCRFDERLPRNGGAEDVDICLRATVYCDRASSLELPVEPVTFSPCGKALSSGDGSSGRGNEGSCSSCRWDDSCVRPVPQRVLIGVPSAVTRHELWSPLGMLSRGLRWGYAGSQLARAYPQLTRRRPISTVEACLVAGPLAAGLVVAAVASGSSFAGARAWRVALYAVALVCAEASIDRVIALPSRLRLASYMPPHSRLTLDEAALFHVCGTSVAARAVGLALLHAGPACLLGLCFQLGELCGKLDRPWQWEKLRLLGRMWDFSFGSDEPAPPKLMHDVARGQWRRVLVASLTACAIEWASTQHSPLEAALAALHPPPGFGTKSRVLSAASAASAASTSTPPPDTPQGSPSESPLGTSPGNLLPSMAASAVGVGVHAAALLAHHILRRPFSPKNLCALAGGKGSGAAAPPDAPQPMVVTRWLGSLVFVTWHAHALCVAYYTCALVASTRLKQPMPLPVAMGPIDAIDVIVRRGYTLAFALGTSLTLLFYLLQYRQARKERRRDRVESQEEAQRSSLEVMEEPAIRRWPTLEEWCDHLEHAPSLPTALLYARTLAWRDCEPSAPDSRTTTADAVVTVVAFVACYVVLIASNWLMTRRWPYPIIDTAHSAAGPLGVASVFMGAAGLCLLCGYLGRFAMPLAAAREHCQ